MADEEAFAVDALAARLTAIKSEKNESFDREALERFSREWQEFCKRQVTVPLNPDDFPDAAAYHEAWDDGEPFGMKCDSTLVNNVLHSMGCQVRLRWQTRKVTLSNGEVQNRYTLARGRFRLGQGKENTVMFPNVRRAEGGFAQS